MTYLERIGGVLVSPRVTCRRLASGAARASDIAFLMLAWFFASSLTDIAHSFVVMRAFDVATGIEMLMSHLSQALLPDVVGIVLAGLILSFFLPNRLRSDVPAFDLAAYAWVPFMVVELAGSLLFTALQRSPTPLQHYVEVGLAIGCGAAVWGCALWAALGRGDR
jgi:hypothetical protein